MRLRELKHGPASAWPPAFGGAYERGDTFPVGEVGVLRAVEPARGMPGLHIEIEYAGRTWSGVMQWDGPEPSVAKVVEVLNRHRGQNLSELRDIELN